MRKTYSHFRFLPPSWWGTNRSNKRNRRRVLFVTPQSESKFSILINFQTPAEVNISSLIFLNNYMKFLISTRCQNMCFVWATLHHQMPVISNIYCLLSVSQIAVISNIYRLLSVSQIAVISNIYCLLSVSQIPCKRQNKLAKWPSRIFQS